MPLKIDEIFAFVAKDQTGEGLMAFQCGDLWMPMICDDAENVRSLLPIAQTIADRTGKPFRLVRFGGREEVTEFDGVRIGGSHG